MYYNILEIMAENSVKYANKVILANENKSGITYRQFYALTGRVYAYLKSQNIGREDFVMICLPRGVQPVIAVGGVIRSGAAFVLVEDNYAPERIEFIKNDCSCKLVIDSSAWEEIQKMQAIDGFEPLDEHAAAFAVYTSGSTGNPKGVLHEYGNYHRIMNSMTMTSCEQVLAAEDRFALLSPLNFIASLVVFICTFKFAMCLHIVPYSIVKNPMKIMRFIEENKITNIFLTPSFIKKMKTKPPYITTVLTGSEPANGVYLEGMPIHNMYMMSESGFDVGHFFLDKSYEEAPVGKSECGYEIMLLDEEGNPVKEGEKGEICFENPFVRGYINLPEQTAAAFKNGIYHTGDLGKKDALGRLIVCGRLNDMVKINGNRVEPGEIEAVASKVLNIDWTAARIIDKGGKVYICVYYLDDFTVDFEKTRKDMEQYLPYYMLPSFFIHIDEIPKKATGKMDRNALPDPVFKDYLGDYVAPRNETEAALCNAFAKVLEIPRLGIKDDFYQLGGDSMGAMEVLMDSNLPGLSVTDIFRGHTPEKIAELYKAHAIQDGNRDEMNAASRKQAHPLTTEQLYMVDYQLYTPKSTMYNLYSMIKLDKQVMDMEKLAAAVNTTLQNHPVFATEFFFNEDGEINQRVTDKNDVQVELERVSERELEEIKKTLVQPFKIINSKLVRARVFETEEAGYLFFDVHHTIFDGTSSKVFFGNIMKAYAEQELEKDYYYYILDNREKLMDSEFYNESREYFANRYGNVEWCKHLSVDQESRENRANEIYVTLPVTENDLDAFDQKYGISRNGFFITVSAIANAIYQKQSDIMLSWIYNGRNDMSDRSSIGLLFRNLPVGIRFSRSMTLKELCDDVNEQINSGISHCCYPYVEANNNVVEDDLTCVLYQDNLRNIEDIPGLLGEVELPNTKTASQNIMDLEILNRKSGIVLMVDYAASLYQTGSIDRYKKIYCATINALLQSMDTPRTTFEILARTIIKLSGEGECRSENWWLK